MWVRGHSRSLKLVPFESFGAVSYSPSVVTRPMAVPVAVCEIFSVKEWRDLEHQVWGRSRSIKMAQFDRPCDFLLVRHCKYSSSVLYHFRVFLTLNNIMTLKSRLEVTQCIETGAIRKLRYGFLFTFYSNYGHICSRLWDI